MNKWEKFLAVNGLIQADLVKYLGVTRSAVSDLVKYDRLLKVDKMYKLVNNPNGWDTSMLTEEVTDPSPQSRDCKDELLDSLRKNIALLEDQVSELKKDKEELREWIKELTRQRKGSG